MIGKYPAKMDDKNRMFVPSKLREELGSVFYVTYGFNGKHKCLTAYTEADWNLLTENFNKLSVAQRSGAASLIFINAVECTPDKQFRFSLSQNLLSYAGIDRDVQGLDALVQQDGNMMKFTHNPIASKEASSFSGLRFSFSNAS